MLYEVDGQQAFRIDLYDHTVAHKWKDLIRSIYVGDGEDMDHIRTFFYLRTNDDIKKILVSYSLFQISFVYHLIGRVFQNLS